MRYSRSRTFLLTHGCATRLRCFNRAWRATARPPGSSDASDMYIPLRKQTVLTRALYRLANQINEQNGDAAYLSQAEIGVGT